MTDQRRIRLTADQRRRIILNAAVSVAERDGLGSITFESVADECSVPTKWFSVRKTFGNKDALMREVVATSDDPHVKEQAVELGIL